MLPWEEDESDGSSSGPITPAPDDLIAAGAKGDTKNASGAGRMARDGKAKRGITAKSHAASPGHDEEPEEDDVTGDHDPDFEEEEPM